MFKRILILCTGNICRSPMTEVLLRERLSNTGISVTSAGTTALIGHAAHSYTLEVMEEHGRDLTEHRAKQVTREMLSQAELILVHDDSHMHWVNSRHPEFRGKTYKLGRWRNNADIADPYRNPKEAFEIAYKEILGDVATWESKLRVA